MAGPKTKAELAAEEQAYQKRLIKLRNLGVEGLHSHLDEIRDVALKTLTRGEDPKATVLKAISGSDVDAPNTDDVLRGIRAIKDLASIDALDELGEDISDRYTRMLNEVTGHLTGIVEGKGLSVVNPGLSTETEEYMRNYSADKVKSIPSEYISNLSDDINLVLAGALSPAQAIQRIISQHESAKHEARRIVRTETRSAQNKVSRQRLDNMGKNLPKHILVKKWTHISFVAPALNKATGGRLAKAKGRARFAPRPVHVKMSEVLADENGLFQLHGADGTIYIVEGPHDEDLPAGEVVNCGCGTSFEIVDRKTGIIFGTKTKWEHFDAWKLTHSIAA